MASYHLAHAAELGRRKQGHHQRNHGPDLALTSDRSVHFGGPKSGINIHPARLDLENHCLVEENTLPGGQDGPGSM